MAEGTLVVNGLGITISVGAKMLRFALLMAIAVAPGVRATTITAVPSPAQTTVGATISVDLQISGLGAGVAPSLGAYDLDLLFSNSILSFQGIVWGSGLDLFGTGDIRDILPGPGQLNLFEVSLNSASDLNQFQPANFLLARLFFTTSALGVSSLDLVVNSAADDNGNPLPVSVKNSQVSVAVPERPTFMLALGGLVCLVFALLRRARRT